MFSLGAAGHDLLAVRLLSVVRRLLFEKHPLQLPEIAMIEKPADHVRRDLRGADRVKLMPGHEFESSIGTRQRSFETRVEKVARFFHDHAGAIRMVVRQPEEGHGLSLAFRPSIFRRSRFEWSRRRRAMWGASAGTGAQPMRLEPRALPSLAIQSSANGKGHYQTDRRRGSSARERAPARQCLHRDACASCSQNALHSPIDCAGRGACGVLVVRHIFLPQGHATC